MRIFSTSPLCLAVTPRVFLRQFLEACGRSSHNFFVLFPSYKAGVLTASCASKFRQASAAGFGTESGMDYPEGAKFVGPGVFPLASALKVVLTTGRVFISCSSSWGVQSRLSHQLAGSSVHSGFPSWWRRLVHRRHQTAIGNSSLLGKSFWYFLGLHTGVGPGGVMSIGTWPP